MIGLIIGLVYLAGWIFSIYPIHFRMTLERREQLRKKETWKDLQSLSPGGVTAVATIVALVWPVFLPYQLSTWLHNKQLSTPEFMNRKALEFENREERYKAMAERFDKDQTASLNAAMDDLDDL